MANVLLVDDHPLVRRLCCRQLEALGHKVTALEDAAAAKQTLTQSVAFDLLISDWSLPGDTDGLQLAGWLRGRGSQMPVLLMSGYAAAEELGGEVNIPVLPKPFTSDELRQRLAELLADSDCAGVAG